MNWNGKIDGDDATTRTIQYFTSWRVWLAGVLVGIGLIAGYQLAPDKWSFVAGYFVGIITLKYTFFILDSAIPSGET